MVFAADNPGSNYVRFCHFGFGIGVGVLALLRLKGWVIPAAWVQNALAVLPEGESFNPANIKQLVSNSGVFFGFVTGFILLNNGSGYSVRGPLWQRGLRYIVGVLGVMVIWMGLRAIFPEGETLLPYSLRYVRYTLTGFWISAGAPWMFLKVRLASPAE